MAEACSAAQKLTDPIKSEENHPIIVSKFPISKPRHKPLTSPIVTSKDLAKELLVRAEKRQRSYPDGVDILLAMKQPSSPLKPPRKEDGKLDASELLSILQDGAEVHYVEKPKPNKVPRLSRGPYKDLKIDPELEKRLALQQLMEFSRKRGRPKKSETESNNNKAQGSSDPKQSKKSVSNKEVKKTPNRELRKLLQDEGAINMLYSIEKGETENKEKLLPSKRRMKKALIKKAQEVTEALLGGTTSSGVSLRHRSISEKRKPSTDSIDSEQSEFQFTPPSDSKIIRRHSSSSSYSSRASSPRMSSPPLVRTEEGVRISERTEQLIEAKCKERNLQPEHSQIIKKLIQEKQNGFKERLQSEFANKLRAAINRNDSSAVSTPEKGSILKMVEEDWGSGSENEAEQHRPKENGAEEASSSKLAPPPPTPPMAPLPMPPPPPQTQPESKEQDEVREEVVNDVNDREETKEAMEQKEDSNDRRLPREVSSYREITMTVTDGLASLSLATNSTILPHALSTKVLRELSLALEYVSQSTDVKCITLMSEGRDFCLGFDLPGLLSKDHGERRALAAQAALAIKEFACKVCMLGKPLIAGVRGRAIGLGTVLLCYCDMVLAEPNCIFSTPYPRLGCFPEAAATTLLPHVIGLAQAKKLLLACARLSSSEAEGCGLVTRIVDDGDLRQQLVEAGKDILTYSPQVMASTKAVVMHGLRTKLPSVLDTEVKLLQQHWTSEDCQRRIATLIDNSDNF